ncbi:MAG: hypothetical protein MJ239_03770 [Bacilli bacterium]|nr:hypothetical protein [Bacilli bacterium]
MKTKKEIGLLIALSGLLSSCAFSPFRPITSSSSVETSSPISSSISTSEVVSSSSSQPSSGSSSSSSNSSSSSKSSSSSRSSSSSSSSSSSQSSSDTKPGYHVADDSYFNLKDVNNSIGMYSLDPIGDQKMLVVPVQFSDGPAWTNAMLKRVETAIFGTSAETNYWESVASFFEKSSYGQLHLTGEITNTVKITNYTVSSFASKYAASYDDLIATVIAPAFYNQASSSLLKEYDQDGDGRIDATLFVYSNNYSYADGSPYWAWVSYPDIGSSKSKPKVSTYFWVSYEFTNEGGTGSKIDAHTFIHECGHVLGLDDYYNYDEEYDPAGDKEMQSYNIGDQGMYSKFALGWVNPYVLDDDHENTVTIPLKSSALYPEAILLNDNWNGTVSDEYILIEYYTPEGNNKHDADTKYTGRDYMYKEKGLRIYHVDARLVKLSSPTSKSSTYVDSFSSSDIVFTGASNSRSFSYLSSNAGTFKLLSLMQSNVTSGSDSDALINGGSASLTGTLYQPGETFHAYSKIFPKGDNKFNDGSRIGYNVTCSSIVGDTAYVTITRN